STLFPYTTLFRSAGVPGFRIFRQGGAVEEAGLGIARRVEDALYMTAVGEHEFTMLAEQSCGPVAGLPGRDVIRGSGDAEHLGLDGLEVDGGAADFQRARGAQRVPAEQLDHVVV